jgi:hypothetical protein
VWKLRANELVREAGQDVVGLLPVRCMELQLNWLSGVYLGVKLSPFTERDDRIEFGWCFFKQYSQYLLLAKEVFEGFWSEVMRND